MLVLRFRLLWKLWVLIVCRVSVVVYVDGGCYVFWNFFFVDIKFSLNWKMVGYFECFLGCYVVFGEKVENFVLF